MSGHQKHPYVGRILKKSLQGSIHAQFYMAIKGPFGQFLLQPRTVSIKRCKNKFTALRRCGILVKVSPDRRVRKWAQMRSNQGLWHRRLLLTAVNATVHIGAFTKLGVLVQLRSTSVLANALQSGFVAQTICCLQQ